MDIERFMAELPELYDDFPNSDRPSRQRFEDIIAVVPNLSTENNLAMLNLAARLLPSTESYVEVGSYFGASLIGAMRGNEDKEFVAIDQFDSTSEPFGGSRRPQVTRKGFDANLERFGS